MSKLKQPPKPFQTKYFLNVHTGKYVKETELCPFQKMPDKLSIETTVKPIIIKNGARKIITGTSNKGELFFTGLIPVPLIADAPVSSISYFGNDYLYIGGKKKNSLVIFKFTDVSRELTIFYFHSYYIRSKTKRQNFIVNYLVSLEPF